MLIQSNYEKISPKAIVNVLYDIYGEKPVIGAEVGVYKGDNANNLLAKLNFRKLYLIDSYSNPYYDLNELALAEQEAHNLLLPYKDKIDWLKCDSLDAITYLPNRLDFVYLDSYHGYPYVLQEIRSWYSSVKMGGVLGGDDFIRTGTREDMQVFTAICEIVAKTGIDIHISKGNYADWWLVKDREQLDFWI